MDSHELLRIEVVAHPDPFIVKLSGEIDLLTVRQVEQLAHHPANGHGSVILDTAGISFFGAAGLRAFAALAQSATEFRCARSNAVVRRVLRITGCEEWLENDNGNRA